MLVKAAEWREEEQEQSRTLMLARMLSPQEGRTPQSQLAARGHALFAVSTSQLFPCPRCAAIYSEFRTMRLLAR